MVEKFIMAGDTALHVCDSEKGDKCVVLLHGYLESMLVWDDFVPHLYKSCRVITLDLPGHGISEVKGEEHTMEFLADVVAAAILKLDAKHCTVMGHSMGGYVALALCERHPELMEGIVLMSSTPYADTEEKKENRRREIELIRGGKKDLIARVAPQQGFAAVNRRAMSDYILDLQEIVYLTKDAGIIALLNGMIQRKDLNEMLRTTKAKVLFILGKQDEYIPLEKAQQMVEEHPEAQVVWLENSGHMGFLEEPEKTAEALLHFMGIEPQGEPMI